MTDTSPVFQNSQRDRFSSGREMMSSRYKFSITNALTLFLVLFLLAPAFHFGLRLEVALVAFSILLVAYRRISRIRILSIFTFVLTLFLLLAVFHLIESPLPAGEFLSSNLYSFLWPARAALLLLVLTLLLNTKERCFNFLRFIFIVSGVLFFLYVIYPFTIGLLHPHHTFNKIDFRLSGFFFNPNYFASVYLFSLSIFFLATSQSLALSGRERVHRFPVSAFFLVFLCIILSQSRGAIVAAFLVSSAFFIIEISRSMSRPAPHKFTVNRALLFSAALSSLLIIGGWVFAFYVSDVAGRFGQIVDVAGSNRGVIWELSMEVIKNRSGSMFLFGSGPGSFSGVDGNERNEWVHNSYLSLLIDYGIYGFLILMSLVFYILLYQRTLASLYLLLPQLIFAISNDVFYTPIFWISMIIPYILNKNGWRLG